MHSILIIDDDPGLRTLLAEYLGGRGFSVAGAENAARGLSEHARLSPDLVVLDIGLPDDDGFSVCRQIRARSATPIIMLTARGEPTDRIVGLELGADDYLSKPFEPRELLARVHAVLRRTHGDATPDAPVLAIGALCLRPNQRTVHLDGQPIELTSTEFDILAALMRAAGRVIPRERLLTEARGEGFGSLDRAVDMHISHLRRKLGDDPRRPVWIKTVRSIGYMMPKDGP